MGDPRVRESGVTGYMVEHEIKAAMGVSGRVVVLYYGLDVRRVPGQQGSEIACFIRLVCLAGFEREYTHTVSSGMKQRVATARPLAYHPAVLLVDDPFGSLHQARGYMIEDLARTHVETMNVLFVSRSVIAHVGRLDIRLLRATHQGQACSVDRPPPSPVRCHRRVLGTTRGGHVCCFAGSAEDVVPRSRSG